MPTGGGLHALHRVHLPPGCLCHCGQLRAWHPAEWRWGLLLLLLLLRRHLQAGVHRVVHRVVHHHACGPPTTRLPTTRSATDGRLSWRESICGHQWGSPVMTHQIPTFYPLVVLLLLHRTRIRAWPQGRALRPRRNVCRSLVPRPSRAHPLTATPPCSQMTTCSKVLTPLHRDAGPLVLAPTHNC